LFVSLLVLEGASAPKALGCRLPAGSKMMAAISRNFDLDQSGNPSARSTHENRLIPAAVRLFGEA
jgi:hypothetical protein